MSINNKLPRDHGDDVNHVSITPQSITLANVSITKSVYHMVIVNLSSTPTPHQVFILMFLL
jgi:hypothetical protein